MVFTSNSLDISVPLHVPDRHNDRQGHQRQDRETRAVEGEGRSRWLPQRGSAEKEALGTLIEEKKAHVAQLKRYSHLGRDAEDT